jgi:bifunctional non-homologous end joining protein LigD
MPPARRDLREQAPTFIAPMLVSAGSLPRADVCRHEVKYDGWRLQLRLEGGQVTARTRRGRDCTSEYPELAELATLTRGAVVLDGELICPDEHGHPDFERVSRQATSRTARRAAHARSQLPVQMMVFDVLHLRGRAVRRLPYLRRRELLEALDLHGETIQVPPAFDPLADDLVEATRRLRMEGIVAKRLDAPYAEARRSPAVVKAKHWRVETLTITGWIPADRGEPVPAGSRSGAATAWRR